MKKSFCELVLDYFPRISQLGNLYATNIANCVFNSLLSSTTIMLNIVTIHAIDKKNIVVAKCFCFSPNLFQDFNSTSV